MSDGWWRTHIPEGEEVLWTGQPHQGYFPPHVGWAYRLLIMSLGLAWLASPWFADTLRDYWKLIGSTGFVAFLMWYDRLLRRCRVYVVTTCNAWWISKIFKPKHVPIDHALNYHRSGQNVVFSRRLFLVFEYLSDPDAALTALNQAREASA